MAPDVVELTGITWDHPRGVAPMEATASSWFEQTGVRVRWSARSLRDFGDANVEGLAQQYDMIVLDYPHIGAATEASALVALDEHLDPAFLAAQAAGSVGASHRSYQLGGHQWALAIDAAAQVSAARPDLLERLGVAWPSSWDEVLALSDHRLVGSPSAVGLPLAPADALCCYLSLAIDAGAPVPAGDGVLIEREHGEAAFTRLAELAARVHPQSLGVNPIRVLDRMAASDEIAYVPLSFGYTNYSRDPNPRPILFGDVPTSSPGRVGAVLGGTGLAVSSRCTAIGEAVAYAAHVADPEVQRGLYLEVGGQPGHRTAWLDDDANTLTRDFFRRTLRTLDGAFLRPTGADWIVFQVAGSDIVHQALSQRWAAARAYRELERCYRRGQSV